MVERALAVVGLAGAILVALALSGALHAPAVPGASGAQYCPIDQYGNQYGDCVDDTIPPTISAARSPAPNANGWNNTNVMLTFTASDEVGGSGVRSIDCNLGGTTNGATRGILFTATTVNTTVVCTATDWAGNVSAPASVTVLIDRVRPGIVLQSRTPPPDPYGWNDTDVTVIWACSDAFSGPVSPTVSRTVTTSGQGQSATGTCTDLAGNTNSLTFFGINIDRTAIPPAGGPPNDNIANATAVPSLPFSDPAADTTNATKEVHEPSCIFPADDKTVWYRFTATQAGGMRVSLSGAFPPGSAPQLSAWRSLSTGLSAVGCAFAGALTFNVLPGVTYYVKAGSTTTGTGPFTITFDRITPPPNDAFPNAKPIASLPFSDPVDLAGATVDAGEPLRPTGTFGPLAATAWYSLTPASNEQVVLGGTASNSAVLAVYTGSTLAGLTQVAGNFGLFPNGSVSYLQPVVFTALAGTTYWIQLGEQFISPNSDYRIVFGAERPITFLGQTPAANGSGWNDTDVRLDWSCSSLLTFGFQTSATATLTTDGTDESATGTCANFFTSVSDTQTGIDIDETRPAIAFAGQTPPPNGFGWNNTQVELDWTCSDSLSGPVAPSVSKTLAGEGGSQPATATCADLAGNTSSDTEHASIDETPPNAPAVSGDRAPEYAGGGGWFRDSVTVSFAGAGDPDGANGAAGSGVDPASVPAPVTFDTQGAHTATGSVADRAGNPSAPASLTVHVDTDAPVLTATYATADGATYVPGTWTDQAVTVTFHCTDGGSGVATTALPQTVSIQGENQSVVGSCTDHVGHTTTQAFGGIDVDLTAPEGALVLDAASLDLVLLPSDEGGSGIDPGPVTPIVVSGKGAAQTRTYLFADGAGNRTKIVVELKSEPGAIQASVSGIGYDGVPATVPFTSLSYSWQANRDGSLKSLDQTLTVGKGGSQQLVDAAFDASKDQTKLTGTLGSSTVAGLELLRVVSSAGGLVVGL